MSATEEPLAHPMAGNAPMGDGAAGPDAKATSAVIRYLDKGAVGAFRAEPTVTPQADGEAFVRVEVFDEAAEDLLIILAEAHVVDGARS